MERSARVHRRRADGHLGYVYVAVRHVGTQGVVVPHEMLSARRVCAASRLCHLLTLQDAMQLLFTDTRWPTAPVEWREHSYRLKWCLWDKCGLSTWLLPRCRCLLFPRVRQFILRIHELLLCGSGDRWGSGALSGWCVDARWLSCEGTRCRWPCNGIRIGPVTLRWPKRQVAEVLPRVPTPV